MKFYSKLYLGSFKKITPYTLLTWGRTIINANLNYLYLHLMVVTSVKGQIKTKYKFRNMNLEIGK